VRLEREQLFALGVGLGVLAGVVLGSLVTSRLGEDTVDLLRGAVERLGHRQRGIAFEALLQ
jgi:hypothetical protein